MTWFKKAKVLAAATLCLVMLPAGTAFGAGENRPFPQHTTYTSGTIKPSNVTQSAMDNAVRANGTPGKTTILSPRAPENIT